MKSNQQSHKLIEKQLQKYKSSTIKSDIEFDEIMFDFNNTILFPDFVDFTPKKQENIADMLLQINQFFSLKTIVYEKESYMLLNGGGAEMMKILEYSKDYALYIEEILKNMEDYVYLLKESLLREEINFISNLPP